MLRACIASVAPPTAGRPWWNAHGRVVAAISRPIVGSLFQRGHVGRIRSHRLEPLCLGGVQGVIEVTSGSQADDADQGQIAPAHPRAPVQLPTRDDHSVMTGRTHRRNRQ